jgi:hypothetical protein
MLKELAEQTAKRTQEKINMDLVKLINQYGFPIVAAFGMGYFIFFVWKWVTTEVKPVMSETSKTLIALVDRIRMLDNDLIRLNTKLNMILEYQEEQEKQNKSRKE